MSEDVVSCYVTVYVTVPLLCMFQKVECCGEENLLPCYHSIWQTYHCGCNYLNQLYGSVMLTNYYHSVMYHYRLGAGYAEQNSYCFSSLYLSVQKKTIKTTYQRWL